MRRIIICPLIIVLLLAISATAVGAEGAGAEQETYRKLLQTVDGSIRSLRLRGSPSEGLSQARTLYNTLVVGENFENRPELGELNNTIDNAFTVLIAQGGNAQEKDIRALRSNISSMAGKLGIVLSPIYEHAMFVIFGIAALVTLFTTLVNRRVVNWERLRQIKAEVSAFQKELRDAQSKRDMKRLHKLQQDQKRIFSLQGQMMKENLKPMLFITVPFFILWFILSGIYGGWVVAWLPFRLDLPFYGAWVSSGFLSWHIITQFGFSQIWRKLLIRD
jgi:uncharacterized membrane protein (DUF106 family)